MLKLEAAWLPLRKGKVHFQETLFALARATSAAVRARLASHSNAR